MVLLSPASLPVDAVPQLSHRNFYPNLLPPANPLLLPIYALGKNVWTRTGELDNSTLSRRRNQGGRTYLDQSVDMAQLLDSISQTQSEQELYAVLSPFTGRQLSIRFMVLLVSQETDWQRSLALLDWINDVAHYSPSVFAYNVVIRNVLRAKRWELAQGLVNEMRQRAVFPDKYTYSTLITAFGKAGMLETSLFWFQQMENDGVSGDLILYSNLIELTRKLCDYSKAISLFARLKRSGISPDLIVYNSMVNVFGKAKLFREARALFSEMKDAGIEPDTTSYSTLLSAFVVNKKFLEALSIFADMNEANCTLDVTTCNIMIDVYGQLDMAKEADQLFWSMRRIGIEPNVVSYNTLLRVYGDAELFGEATHLLTLMEKKGIAQNVVTYNTMIKMYGKSLEHEKASVLIQEMQNKGIEPDVITYSTMISIWSDAGRLDRAVTLFEKLRDSGAKIDEVLYQTMVVAYEKAGLVANAKHLLCELKHPSNITREAAIKTLANAGRIEEVTWVFRQAFDASELKEISVFECLIELFSNNKRHHNVIEVFEKMRQIGFFPDSSTVSLAFNSYGKLQDFEKAYSLYNELQADGCVFSDEVHFQMLSLCYASRDFVSVDTIVSNLHSNPNINKKELYLVAKSLSERSDGSQGFY